MVETVWLEKRRKDREKNEKTQAIRGLVEEEEVVKECHRKEGCWILHALLHKEW
jgi:hypothetical protein